jgi:hypothetical protein
MRDCSASVPRPSRRAAAALVEGRFFQVPNSAIQALEGRANVSIAFGNQRASQILSGTLGPAVSIISRLGGPMEARGPAFGVRFRRDTKKAGSLGLQIDYAPLRATGCSSDCEPNAILAQGAHGGLGADIVGGGSVMVNVNSRVLWFQRNSGQNVFLLQAGASVSPKLESR